MVEEMAPGRSQLRDPSGLCALMADEEQIEPDVCMLVGRDTGNRAQAETHKYVAYIFRKNLSSL